MTQDTPEPAERDQSPDANQDARVSGHGRTYQAARDLNITELHYHSGPDSDILGFSFIERDVASTKDTVARVQESIGLHHRLIDLLYQMLRNVQQAVGTLTAERDALREELRVRDEAHAELQETRARLNDTRQRLKEAERVQAETTQRLNHVQRQRAEAEQLKKEAVEQLSRMQARLADFQHPFPSSVGRQVEQLKEAADSAAPLMGETDQQVASDVLRRVDDVLEQEAVNLNKLRGIVSESGKSDAVTSSDSLSAPMVQSDDITHNAGATDLNIKANDVTDNESPLAECAKSEGNKMQEASKVPLRSVTSRRSRSRQAMLMITHIGPWSIIEATGVAALFIWVVIASLSVSRFFLSAGMLHIHGAAGWLLIICWITCVITLLAGALAVIYNISFRLFGLGVILTFTESERKSPKQARLRIKHIYVRWIVSTAYLGGLVSGGIYALLGSSGSLHTVALFASQSTSHRIAVTVGSAIAFALYGGLMAFLYNIIPQIECIFVEAPIDRKPNRRLRQEDLQLRQIGPGRVILFLSVIGLMTGAAYVALYTSGALYQINSFAHHNVITKIYVTASAIAAITLIVWLGMLIYNAYTKIFKGVQIILAET